MQDITRDHGECDKHERPQVSHRADCITVTVRRAVGLEFRQRCDWQSQRANERLEELIAIWNVRGRPDVTGLTETVEAGWEDGRSRFRIHRGFAAMARTWARERRKRYYEILEGIMIEWMEGQNGAW